MSQDSKIEWTNATWNPVRGCTKISPGCAHCYAETFAERWRGVKGHPYEQGFDLRLVPEKLTEPLKWRNPKLIFVNSMSDLFQADVPFDYVDRVFAVMALAHWHTFQVLTKRADLMREYMQHPSRKRLIAMAVMAISNQLAEEAGTHKARIKLDDFGARFRGNSPFPNVWLGVSIENKKHGWPRVYELRHTPAAVRFFSVEPLLEDVTPLRLNGIHWVIVGGESGPHARPMHPDWVRSIRDQCVAAGVPFFFKQWGEFAPYDNRIHGMMDRPDDDTVEGKSIVRLDGQVQTSRLTPQGIARTGPAQQLVIRVGKKAAGRLLDGREWNEMPVTRSEVPA